jgi:hypothetical protein
LKEVKKPLNPAMWSELHLWYENCVSMDYLSVEQEHGFEDEGDDLYVLAPAIRDTPKASTSTATELYTPTTSNILVMTPRRAIYRYRREISLQKQDTSQVSNLLVKLTMKR